MLVGLSLSFCVSDIINGLIDRNDVLYIISGTRVRNGNELADLINNYVRFYWQDNPELGREIALDLFNRGMILQPRLSGGDAPCVVEGRWLTLVPNEFG